jgi:cobalt/nickel transport protein
MARAPNALMVTQTIKADANRVFPDAAPSAGWREFAALSETERRVKRPSDEEKAVEIGAEPRVHFEPRRSL